MKHLELLSALVNGYVVSYYANKQLHYLFIDDGVLNVCPYPFQHPRPVNSLQISHVVKKAKILGLFEEMKKR